VSASRGGRIGLLDNSHALLISALLNDVAKFTRSLRINLMLVPNCRLCTPFDQERSSVMFHTGVILVRLLVAGIRSSNVRKLTSLDPLKGDEPACSNPNRVKPPCN